MAPLCSFNDGKDVTVHGATCLRPEAAGHLLTALALPQVTLGHVVVEADGKVMQAYFVFLFFMTTKAPMLINTIAPTDVPAITLPQPV